MTSGKHSGKLTVYSSLQSFAPSQRLPDEHITLDDS